MKAKEKQALQQKLEEIRTIEDHLETIREQYREQQLEIEALEQALEEQYREYSLFDSKISQVLLGKHSSERIMKVEESKEQYLQNTLQLADCERISQSLKDLESTLLTKLEKKKSIVRRLQKMSDEGRATETGEGHPDVDLLQQYARAIDHNLDYIAEITDLQTKGQQTISALQEADGLLAEQLDASDNSPLPWLQLSIFTTIDGLEEKLTALENQIQRFFSEAQQLLWRWNLLTMDLAEIVEGMDDFQFFYILHDASQPTQIGFLQSSISGLVGKILYIQSQLDLETETTEQEVLNLQEHQLDLLLQG